MQKVASPSPRMHADAQLPNSPPGGPTSSRARELCWLDRLFRRLVVEVKRRLTVCCSRRAASSIECQSASCRTATAYLEARAPHLTPGAMQPEESFPLPLREVSTHRVARPILWRREEKGASRVGWQSGRRAAACGKVQPAHGRRERAPTEEAHRAVTP